MLGLGYKKLITRVGHTQESGATIESDLSRYLHHIPAELQSACLLLPPFASEMQSATIV